MSIKSLGQGLLRGTSVAMSTAGFVGVVFGSTYILDCRRFATTNEGIQGCYAFGGAMAGVGAGVSGIRSSGFEKGFATYNPSLRGPEPITRRRKKQGPGGLDEPDGPDEGGRDS